MKELEEMKEAFDNLTKSALQLNEMYKKKSKIIEKAIEYITPIVELDNDIMLKGTMLKPVLEILKGDR